MANEKIMASMTLKSRSGLSVFSGFNKFSFSRLDDFQPITNQVDKRANLLTQGVRH